jgi:phosphatidylglycerol---prolipoprotein diacylglyceryl transferase
VHPILLHLGSFPIHTYGALGSLAFAVGAGLVILRGARAGHPANRMADLVFVGAVAAVLGARLLFVLQEPGSLDSVADLFDLRGGGLVFYGSLLLGLPVGTVAMRAFGLPVLSTWDIVATALPVAHAISRVGCFAAGCCYGSPTGVAWAVTYPPGPSFLPDVPVHPVQLYEALALVVIGALVNLQYTRRRFDGQALWTYVLLYAVARAGLEVFRGDVARGEFLPALFGDLLSFSQGLSALFGAAAVVALVVLGRRHAARRAVGRSIVGPT